MTPQMGVVTPDDVSAAVAAEAAARLAADAAEAAARAAWDAAHVADAAAHHSTEIPEGRAASAAVTLLSEPGVVIWGTLAQAYAVDTIYHFPLYVRTPITVDQVTFEITVAGGAGTTCRIGIYAADLNWQPLALKVASAQLAIDAVGVVNGALAATVLQEGRYLIAFHLGANVSCQTARYVSWPCFFNPVFSGSPIVMALTKATAYAALADPGVAWDTIGYGVEGIRRPILLRVSVP